MKSIEIFKIFSAPMPQGTRLYTINMDVKRGSLILLNHRKNIIEETDHGLLWCQSPTIIGDKIIDWFSRGYPVETGWAYPATVSGPEGFGLFIQGVARMAERQIEEREK